MNDANEPTNAQGISEREADPVAAGPFKAFRLDIIRRLEAELEFEYSADKRFRAAMEPIGGKDGISTVANVLGGALADSVNQLAKDLADKMVDAIVRKAQRERAAQQDALQGAGESLDASRQPEPPTV